MPKDFKLRATLAAPPSLFSRLVTDTMGTGASGEMRLTDPHKYASIITSPITNTFWPFILSKKSSIFKASVFYQN
jgi:hypothetical protein